MLCNMPERGACECGSLDICCCVGSVNTDTAHGYSSAPHSPGDLQARHTCAVMWTFCLLVLVILLTLRLIARCTVGMCRSNARMDGKTVLVTGSNTGIGKETALDLARRGARVILACRDLQAAARARDEIVRRTGNRDVVVRRLDLSSLQSVREFAREVNAEERRLDVLVHNAGVAEWFTGHVTADGLSLTMATNHFGPFLLTHLLIDLLKRSAPSRIVVVSSIFHFVSRLDLSNINPVKGIPVYHYSLSKLHNIVFTLELARRLQGTGVTANCLHPGFIQTDVWRNVPREFILLMRLLLKVYSKTALEGAQTTIHVAVSEELEGVSGKHFADCQEFWVSCSATDVARAKRFWELSEEFVRLRADDPHI